MPRFAAAVLALLLVAPLAAASSDPLQVHLFSGVDREAVEVGGLLQINLEVLAVPTSERARGALETAFRLWDVGAQLGDEFALVR